MIVAPHRPASPSLQAAIGHPSWSDVPKVNLACTWRGDPAPAGVDTTARVLWTDDALWIGFVCRYTELDVVPAGAEVTEHHGLWEHDVCEVFVQSPREASHESYKEFEVAPSGHWLDVAIRTPRIDVDWRWDGGLQVAAAIDRAAYRWQAVMRIPFEGLGGRPQAGDVWRANLFRIGRVNGVRQYLAYAPTGTPTPDFHVPDRFAELRFAGRDA